MHHSETAVTRNNILLALLCILLCVLSATVVTSLASSPSFQEHSITSLEEKRKDVQELTAAATATSIAITLLPGDAATPVADKLADLSQYMLLVLCAIYLEKYMVTVMGLISFRYIVPVSLLLIAVSFFIKRHSLSLRSHALRLLGFGLALYFVIPVSIKITDVIEKTYVSSIENTLQSADQISGEAEAEAEAEEALQQEADKEPDTLLEKIMDIPSSLSEKASDVVANVSQISEEKIRELETVLNNFMESIAMMIITSCVIPILVLLSFFFIVKLFFRVDPPIHFIPVPDREN